MTNTNTAERDALTADFHALRERIDLRFTSGNDVAVERASITIDEWMRLRSLATKGDRTANASEASVPVAWLLRTDGYSYAHVHREAAESEFRALGGDTECEIVPLYAAPPSDRAAVEGVTLADAVYAWIVATTTRRPSAVRVLRAERGIRDAYQAYERARASDTNDAAARPTPRAAYRQPNFSDAAELWDKLPAYPGVNDVLDALNSIGAVIPADRGEGGA